MPRFTLKKSLFQVFSSPFCRRSGSATVRRRQRRWTDQMTSHAAAIESLESRLPLSATAAHAPTGTSGTVSTEANTPYTLKTTDFGFSDPNDSPANTFMAVKFPILPNAGTLRDNGTALTAGQFVTVSDISAGKLIFTPNTGLPVGTYFMAEFQVQDNGSTSNGGQNLDPNPKVLDIQMTASNQTPVGTSGTVTTPGSTPYVLKTSDFGFTDPNPANSFLAVKVDLLPNAGTLDDNGVPVAAGDFVNVANINAGNFVFTPSSNLNFSTYFLMKFQVEDSGQNLDPNPKVLDVLITSGGNQGPTGTSATLEDAENNPHIFKTSDFGFSDSNAPSNTFTGVKIDILPNSGTLTDNGSPVVAGQIVSVADINAGEFVFTPNKNLTGGPYFMMEFQVQDSDSELDPNPKVLDVQIVLPE